MHSHKTNRPIYIQLKFYALYKYKSLYYVLDELKLPDFCTSHVKNNFTSSSSKLWERNTRCSKCWRFREARLSEHIVPHFEKTRARHGHGFCWYFQLGSGNIGYSWFFSGFLRLAGYQYTRLVQNVRIGRLGRLRELPI